MVFCEERVGSGGELQDWEIEEEGYGSEQSA
jgi:hypothetical protein